MQRKEKEGDDERMKIAVIGATGKAGRLIAREAAKRGIEVTAITRPASIQRLDDNYKVIPKDLFELTSDDVKDFDAVVDAFGTDFAKPGSEYLHVKVMEHLISIMEPLPEVRLLVVGGAASLFKDETRTRRLLEDISPSFAAVPQNMFIAYNKLAGSQVNYTFMSPAETFDAGSPGVGSYTLGTDYVIYNSAGRSYITYEDYALAMVDELENKAFVRQRFTAVSESKYKNDAKDFFRLGPNAFTRRGSYFAVYSAGMGTGYGAAKLFIGSRRGGNTEMPNHKLIDIAPIYNGKKIPYSVWTRPTELILRTQYGNIRICYAEKDLMLIKGENGLGIRIDKEMIRHELFKPRGNKSWEGVFRWTCSLVFTPWQGSIQMDAPWDWEKLSTPVVKGDFLPDENGDMLISIEEFGYAGKERESVPTYEEGLADVTADWEGFLAKQPQLSPEYEEQRKETAWLSWSHLMTPFKRVKRTSIFMTSTYAASEWQMCENAVAMSNHLPIALDLMLNMVDNQAPTGQLPDFYDDMRGIYQLTKPPLQGWALKYLMKKYDFSTEVPSELLNMMYDGYSAWANWFMKYRDDDHDGLPQYEHGDETGNDDSAIFKGQPQMELPELAAFLGLLFESLGDLANVMGKDKATADEWYRRSKDIIDRMIATYWNGSRFIGLTQGDHRIVDTKCLQFYRPLVLGKRLPQEIIDKMAADLSVEGEYLTPNGLMGQSLTSDDFTLTGFSGRISTTDNLLIITGLFDAGKTELAKMLAKRICDGMKLGGSPYLGPSPVFAGSWGAAGFQILADLYTNW